MPLFGHTKSLVGMMKPSDGGMIFLFGQMKLTVGRLKPTSGLANLVNQRISELIS